MYTGRQAKTVVSGLDPLDGTRTSVDKGGREEGRKEGEEKVSFFAYLVVGSSWQFTAKGKNVSRQKCITQHLLYPTLCTLEGKQRQWSVDLTLWMVPGPVWTREEGGKEGRRRESLFFAYLVVGSSWQFTAKGKNVSRQKCITQDLLYSTLCTLEGKQRQWSVDLTLWMVPGPVWTREGERESVFFLLTLSSVHLGSSHHLGSSQLKERTLVDKNASHKTFSILLYVHWKASKDSGQWT